MIAHLLITTNIIRMIVKIDINKGPPELNNSNIAFKLFNLSTR